MSDLLERFDTSHVPEEAIRHLIDNHEDTDVYEWLNSHRAIDRFRHEEELKRYVKAKLSPETD